jgi:hypothetical protein
MYISFLVYIMHWLGSVGERWLCEGASWRCERLAKVNDGLVRMRARHVHHMNVLEVNGCGGGAEFKI